MPVDWTDCVTVSQKIVAVPLKLGMRAVSLLASVICLGSTDPGTGQSCPSQQEHRGIVIFMVFNLSDQMLCRETDMDHRGFRSGQDNFS